MADAPPSDDIGEPLPSSLVGFVATGLDRAIDVDLSADGRTVAVGGVGHATAGAVAIHDVRSRSELLLVELDYVPFIDLAEDGRLALVWGDSDASIYDANGSAPVSVAHRPPGGPAISGASLSPDATIAAVLWSDGSTTFHDTATGDRLELPSPPRHDGIGVFLPDGTLSLLAADDEWAHSWLWDVASGQSVGAVALEQPPLQFEPRTYTVSPDRTLLVGTSVVGAEHGGRMDVWGLGSGRLLDEPASRPRARGRAVFVTERVIAFGRDDGILAFYDLATERTVRAPIQAHRGVIRDVWASHDGDTVVSIADDGLIGVWGPDDRSLIDRPIILDRRLGAISADGSTLAVLTPDGRAEAVALDSSSAPVAIDVPAGVGLTLPHQSLALSADGARILVLNQDGAAGRAFVAATHTGETVWVNETGRPELYIENGDISPDGTRVFLELYWGSRLQSIDVATGEVLAQVDADAPGLGDGSFWTVEVTPDGRFVDIIHGSTVARFDADTLELITTVEVGELAHSPVGALAHVPGSNDVLAAGLGGQIHRIDMTSGEITTGQSRDTTSVGQISISADGSVIAATQFFTSAIALFDDALAPIGDPLPAFGFGPWWFTSDGDLLGSAAFGIVQRELDPDEWQAIACRAAGRNLTRAEWAEYLGDEIYRATCPEWPPAPN